MKKAIKIKESPLFWPVVYKGNHFMVLDETLIPLRLHYIRVENVKAAVEVIREMKTRAFGQFLVVFNTFLIEIDRHSHLSPEKLAQKIAQIADQLNKSRPTFPFAEVTQGVVWWAQQALKEKRNMPEFVKGNILGYLDTIHKRRLHRVQRVATLMKNNDTILTHCNVSGELAMASHIAKQQGKRLQFFATETRPYLQGSKLTCWELKLMGADVTLIADNAIGSVMSDGMIDKVIVGSDRSCANGDIANKIGTYQIAVLAKEFGIPLYALTQPSNKIQSGDEIPIEIRHANELLTYYKKKIVSGFVSGFYPGFDIVPNELITKSIALNVR